MGRVARALAQAIVGPVLLCALFAPAAHADWRVVQPPAGVGSVAVADADTWLVERPWSCCAARFDLTEDAGASWLSSEIAEFPVVLLIGAADDGTFRLLARRNAGESQEAQVFKVGPGGPAPLGPILKGDNPIYASAAVSGDGATWVPHRVSGGSFVLSIIAADGTESDVPLPGGSESYGWEAVRTVLGMRLLRYVSDPPSPGSFHPEKGTFQLGPGNEILPAELYPVSVADGDWMVSSHFGETSWDGGAHWAASPFFAVPRAPAGEMPRYLNQGGTLAERISPFLFRASGLEPPQGVPTSRVVDAGRALVAWGPAAVYVWEAPLPLPPGSIGDLQPDTQRMLARADLFRADAGLPPLIGDAKISAAARNHSVYTTLNKTEANLSAHGEQPGKPGFTGIEPSERCAAAGANCGSEVMFSPGVVDPVGGWLATVYHRPLPGSPRATLVGAAEASGGWAVMDGGYEQNVLTAPFGYPVGRWRGEAGFGGEIPDPVSFCRSAGQNIDYPIGIAVSLYIPSEDGTVSAIDVHRRGDSRSLPGCLLQASDGRYPVGFFILDEPLIPHQAYDVSARWNPGGDEPFGGGAVGPDMSYSWSFNFDEDPVARPQVGSPTCRALGLRTITSVARARRGGGSGLHLGIEEKVRLKTKGLVRLRQARLIYWKAHVRRSVKLGLGRLRRRPKLVGKTSYLRFRLPRSVLPRVEPGEDAELILGFTGRRLKGCRQVAHLAGVRKIQFGWVRLRGEAAWVSGSSKKGR